MAIFSVNDIAIKGMAGAVPAFAESNNDYDWISEDERALLIKTTGVLHRRKAQNGIIASDLCYHAAKKLIEELGWATNEIELLVFVSQARDYILPSTATILQDRLGLPKSCVAFDVPLGCSGFVYGLSIVAGMMRTMGLKKGLLLTGDTSGYILSKQDKSTYPLFGDGAAATALISEQDNKMDFNLQSDGKGYEAIIVPDGGARNQTGEATFELIAAGPGIIRSKGNLWLNGLDVFSFSVKEVPENVRALTTATGQDLDGIDYFVMHQANLLLNETIRKKLKIAPEKVPYSLKEFGNTSSASIPLTMVSQLKEQLTTGRNRLLLSGFGIGLSWGSVILDTENLVIPDIIEL